MRQNNPFYRLMVLLAAVLWPAVVLRAGVTNFTAEYHGTQIANQAVIYLQDDQYPYMFANPGTWPNVFTNYNVINRVRLKYLDSQRKFYSASWTVSVPIEIKTYSTTGSLLATETKTLSIGYDPAGGSTYTAESVYQAVTPGYRTEVKVTAAPTLSGIAALPNDVLLESEIEVERYYDFDETAVPDINHTVDAANGTMTFYWEYLPGAEEYDLEWLYVSDYDAAAQASPDYSKATRVTLTTPQSYTINTLFDNGDILYRIRGAGRHGSDFTHRKEGVWGTAGSTVAVTNPYGDRNWAYSADYAEDGLRKEGLTLFDGNMRQRQSVMLRNTDNIALVGEIFYDYEGRAAVQTLPAPTASFSSNLKFHTQFSLNTSGSLYSRQDFDNDALFNNSNCSMGGAGGMKNTEGASRYYSDQNGKKNYAFHAAIPAANNYPFVQTMYDREGRVKKESQAGENHKIESASGHEVEYFYATASQDKLDRLFGNEIGYTEHYSLKATKDPNGQLSLSYLDLSGRAVATSLAGDKPSAMDAVEDYALQSFTDNFDYLNHYDPAQQAWVAYSNFLVTNPGSDYDFSYEITPEEYSALCAGISGDCKYLLTIDIYDGCNNVVQNTGTPLIHVVHEVNPNNLTLSFTVQFPRVGTYRIEKKLTLDPLALQDAVDDFIAGLPGTCITSLTELNSQYSVPTNDCNDCAEYCAELADAMELTGADRTDFIATCLRDSCLLNGADTADVACEVMLDIFKDDLSPGGQYYEATDWMEDYIENATGTTFSWSAFNYYLNNTATGCSGSSYSLGNWTDVVNDWEDCFAEYLVQFHPEYCHYEWCLDTKESQEFDVEIHAGSTYAWATTYPNSTTPYIDGTQSPVGQNLLNADPYFATGAVGAGDKLTMYDGSSVSGYLTDNDGSGTDMWTQAGTLAGCTSCDAQWQIFRSLYLSRKAELMRQRRNSNGCYPLHDWNHPPDNIANGPTCGGLLTQPGCNPAGTVGFIIRVPDYIEQLNPINTQSEAENWGDSLLIAYNACKTAASSYAAVEYGGGVSSMVFGSNCTTPITITVCGSEITGNFCPEGTLSESQLALLLANAINVYTSTPHDYTAAIDPADATKVLLYGPAYLGSSGNCTASVSIPTAWQSTLTLTVPTFSGGADSGGCPDGLHCFCAVIDQLNDLYAATDPDNGGAYYIDHSLYTTANDYIIAALNDRYGYTATATQVNNWLANCAEDMSDPENPDAATEETLPDALDCENPAVDCDEDQPEIQGYNAQWVYDQLVEQAVDSFIVQYVRQCFSGDFEEHFNVTYEEREHHYTLYYYDQSGNLTRTIPPAGVRPLNATDVGLVQDYRNGVTGTPVYPDHARSSNNMVTNYKYNTFDERIEQTTPDGGTTVFYYDHLGRGVASQDAKQAAMSGGGIYVYGYILFDEQSRPIEGGQVSKSVALTTTTASNYQTFVSWVTTSSSREQVTNLYYDEALNVTVEGQFTNGQEQLRKRIASSTYEFDFDNDPDTYDAATHYSYDIHGNICELIQENTTLASLGEQYKKIQYSYDLISGHLKQVSYQPGNPDQFYHRYWFDVDNQLTNVWTSRDQVIWEQDAKYYYYLHGSKARLELGHEKVQGVDFAYTINGWMKGVNSNVLNETKDLGKDGGATTSTAYQYLSAQEGLHSNIARDAYGFTLSFFWNSSGGKDYTPINTSAQSLWGDVTIQNDPAENLFNGSVKEMAVALAKPNGSGLPLPVPLQVYHYHYDQLYRLKQANAYTGSSTTLYSNLSNVNNEYMNTFTYDANSNIFMQLRNGYTSVNVNMDDLHYYYYKSDGTTYDPATAGVALDGTNKLAYVSDDPTYTGNYTTDIDDQSATYGSSDPNYEYDPNGGLIKDKTEEIDEITWTLNGKIKSIKRTSTSTQSDLEFAYDPAGRRIMKLIKPRTGSGISYQKDWTYIYYVRGVQGNIIATYERKYYSDETAYYTDQFNMSEWELYGSSRLGILRPSETILTLAERTYDFAGYNSLEHTFDDGNLQASYNATAPTTDFIREAGNKLYELENHLDNVLVVVSDRKLPVQGTPSTAIAYYMSDVRAYGDYYPYGAEMDGRNDNSSNYRFGFNGQEKDNEVTGINGSSYTAEFWQYDSRLGRRWNIDPVTVPSVSSYCVMLGDPISKIDPNGDLVDLGDPKTREGRRNRRRHRKLYKKDAVYTAKYDELNAKEETYHMRYSTKPGITTLRNGGTITHEENEIYWDYTYGFTGAIEIKGNPPGPPDPCKPTREVKNLENELGHPWKQEHTSYIRHTISQAYVVPGPGYILEFVTFDHKDRIRIYSNGKKIFDSHNKIYMPDDPLYICLDQYADKIECGITIKVTSGIQEFPKATNTKWTLDFMRSPQLPPDVDLSTMPATECAAPGTTTQAPTSTLEAPAGSVELQSNPSSSWNWSPLPQE